MLRNNQERYNYDGAEDFGIYDHHFNERFFDHGHCGRCEAPPCSDINCSPSPSIDENVPSQTPSTNLDFVCLPCNIL